MRLQYLHSWWFRRSISFATMKIIVLDKKSITPVQGNFVSEYPPSHNITLQDIWAIPSTKDATMDSELVIRAMAIFAIRRKTFAAMLTYIAILLLGY